MEIKYHNVDAMVLAKSLGAPVVHGCNAMGVMGSGFAAMIANRYPEAEEAYTAMFLASGLPLGSYTQAVSNDVLVINLITQFGVSATKRMTNYEAMAIGFESLNKELSEAGVKDLVMPAIGADLGRGSWRVISSLLEVYFTDVQVHVCYLDQARWDLISKT